MVSETRHKIDSLATCTHVDALSNVTSPIREDVFLKWVKEPNIGFLFC